uniref:tRNA(Ile)-lysidine synthetase n=1 Tax=Hyaloperonospora arabidopsidis (strain Emoy2) TaxID=559515 RepID=M4BXN0_HYAAE
MPLYQLQCLQNSCTSAEYPKRDCIKTSIRSSLENHIETPLLAVTVDHQLRPESSREALEVANICADRGGIRHITKVCEWECEEKTKQQPGEEPAASLQRPVKPRASKMEEHARQYRYDLLRQVCLEYHVRCLFVAHNRGDQLETTLFRLGRASGINGLAGIASQLPLFSVDRLLCHPLGCEASTTSNMTTIVRPLLSVTKDQLMATCDRLQQKWTHDPSNDDPTYDRVRIRQTAEKAKREFAELVTAIVTDTNANL